MSVSKTGHALANSMMSRKGFVVICLYMHARLRLQTNADMFRSFATRHCSKLSHLIYDAKKDTSSLHLSHVDDIQVRFDCSAADFARLSVRTGSQRFSFKRRLSTIVYLDES